MVGAAGYLNLKQRLVSQNNKRYMLEEAFSLLKKYDFRQELAVGEYIDAKDSVDKWCVAIITRLDSDYVGLHYEGWGSRYDIQFRRTSAKLQAFRRQVLGYTGQTKNTLRDFNVNEANQKQISEKISSLLENNLQGMGPHKLTQFIRGQFYFYIDSLLTHNDIKPQHLPFLYESMELLFKLISKWASLSPSLIPLILENKKTPNLYLVHEPTAIAMVYPELMDSVVKLFSGSVRVERKLKELQLQVGKSGSSIIETLQKQFLKGEAFTHLLQLLEYKNQEQVMRSDISGRLALPFELAYSILNITRNICQRKVALDNIDNVILIINKRIEQIDNTEIKELEKRKVKDAIDILVAIKRSMGEKGSDITRFRDQQELTLAAKFIRSPFLQKRIQGLNDLKEFSKRLHSNKYAEVGMDSKSFCSWLQDEKIIPHIFGESCHGQLVQRSGELLRLLSQYNKLPVEYVDILWNSTQGKHEDIVRRTYDVIVNLVEWLDLRLIEQFFARISQIAVAEYDLTKVQFFYYYSKNVKRNIQMKNPRVSSSSGLRYSQSQSQTKIDSTKYYNPKILWNVMTEHSDPDVRQQAANFLNELLTSEAQELRSLFFGFSVQNIVKHKCFVLSLEVLISLIDKSQNKSRKGFLESLKKTSNHIIDIILGNAREYISKVRAQISALKIEPQHVASHVFEFNRKHQEVVRTVQDALYQLSTMSSDSQFNNEEIQIIWDVFIDRPLCPQDPKIFFHLFTRQISQQRPVQRLTVLSEQNKRFLLLEVFSKYYNFSQLTIDAFYCIKKLFYMVNRQEKNIQFKGNSEWYQANPFEYQGFQQIWRCATEAEDQRTFQLCCKYMIEILLQNRNDYDMKNNINQYLHRCCSTISSNSTHITSKLLIKLVKMLRMMVIKAQGLILVNEPQHINPEYNMELVINVRVDQVYKIMKVIINTQSHQIIHLRKRISQRLSGRGFNDFYIYADRIHVDLKYDNNYFQSFENYRNWEVVLREPRFKTHETPRYTIANNLEYLHSLFHLLSLNDAAVLNEVWELMSLLPPNLKIKEKLIDLKLAKGSGFKEWQDFLEMKNPRLLSYYLRLLQEMIYTKEDHNLALKKFQNKKIPANVTPSQQIDFLVKGSSQFEDKVRYTKNFINRGGFTFVRESLTKGKWIESPEHDIIEVKCVVFMFRIMTTPLLAAVTYDKEQVSEIIASIFRMMNVISVFDNSSAVIGTPSQEEEKEEKEEGKEEHQPAQQQQSVEDYCQVVRYGFLLLKDLLLGLQKHRVDLLEQSDKAITTIIIMMVLKQPNERIRAVSADSFFEIGQAIPELTLPMIHKLLKSYEEALEAGQQSHTYFILTNSLMDMDELRTSQFLRTKERLLNEMWKRVSSEIIRRSIHESKSSDKDVALHGTLVLAKSLLPSLKSIEDIQLLHSHLLTQRLFQRFQNTEYERQMQRLLFKNSETRKAALNLLLELSSRQEELAFSALKHLLPFHTEDSWRKWTNSDWNIICDHKEKSETGYVGLKNLGATCYMNSLLQQLFMIPAFRKTILEARNPLTVNEEGEQIVDQENIIWQLKRVFGALSESDEQYYDPTHFVQSFKDIDGSAINPLEQRDVDQFFNMLMDRVETQLQGSSSLRELNNIFGGKLSNELICLDCPHRSEREEPFLAMPLKVVSKKNLKESLDAYVEGDLLEGDNAFHCQKCDKKVTTLKRCSVKRLPNTLLLVLKRFEFNFDTMEKYKVNDFLQFPTELNMKDYTQESLSKRDLLKKLGLGEDSKEEEGKGKESSDVELNQDHIRVLQKSYPDDYYNYKLKGVLIHYGESEHGHYYSFISERVSNDERWFQFDDKNVTNFNPRSIPSQAYGGLNPQTNRNTLHNAYLLFYERVKQVDTERLEHYMEDIMGREINMNMDRFHSQQVVIDELAHRMQELQLQVQQIASKGEDNTLSSIVKMPSQIIEIVREANHRFWLGQNIFNPDYIGFLQRLHETLASDASLHKNSMDYDYASKMDLQKADQPLKSYEITRFGLIVFLTTIVRFKHRRHHLFSFVKLLKQALSKDIAACLWLLQSFTSPILIREMLIECPNSEVTHHIEGLLKVAMAKVYPIEVSKIQTFANDCFVRGEIHLESASKILEVKVSPPDTMVQSMQVEGATPSSSSEPTSSQQSNVPQRSYPEAQLGISHKCPYLLAFVNAFLHQIFPNLKKFDNSMLYFYKIIHDFAELGPEARLYLLMCKVPHIFLDVLHYNDKAPLYKAEAVRNIIMVHLPEHRVLTIGQGKIVPKEKSFYRSVPSGDRTATYLLTTLSSLVCSCVFKEQIEGKKESVSLNVQTPCFKLSPDESDSLGNRVSQLRNKILAEANSRIACKAIGEMFAHVSYSHKERTLDIMNAVFSHVEREGENRVQRFLDILAIVFKVRDEMRTDRGVHILTQIQTLLKKSDSVIRFFLQLVQFILLLAKQEPTLLKDALTGLSDINGLFAIMRRFFEYNRNINFHSYKIYFFKSLKFEPNHFQDYLTNDFQRELTQYCRETFDRIKKLFNNGEVKYENVFDCDAKYQFDILKPGETVDFQSYYEWVPADVIENSGEMLKIQPREEQNYVFVESDSDQLAPAKTQTKSKQAEIDLNFNLLFNAILEYQAKIAAQAASRG